MSANAGHGTPPLQLRTTRRPDKALPIRPNQPSTGMHASVQPKKNTWAAGTSQVPPPQGARRATAPGLQEMSPPAVRPSSISTPDNDSQSHVVTPSGDVASPLAYYFTNMPVTLSPSPSLSLVTSPPPSASAPSQPPPISLPQKDQSPSIVNSSQPVIATLSGIDASGSEAEVFSPSSTLWSNPKEDSSEDASIKPQPPPASKISDQLAMKNESMTDVSSITLDPSQDPTRPADGYSLDESKVPEKSKTMWKWKGLRRRWIPWCPAWLLWCLFAMIVSLVLGITLGFQLRVRDVTIPLNQKEVEIILSPTLVDVDPAQKTMTIHWVVVNVTENAEYDIFFDRNLLFSEPGSTKLSNNIPDTPVFSINGTLYNFNGSDAVLANIPFFPTKLFLTVGRKGDRVGGTRTLQTYPFDFYETEIFIFARTKGDGNETSDNLVPIAIRDAGGIAAGFNTKINVASNGNYAIAASINISRGLVVRIYSIIIVVAIWLVTLALLSATISAAFLGRRMAKEVMVVPVATVFAFTQLRGTLPGAPNGFGATIDFIGILPCLAILSLCAVLLLAVFLFRNPEMDWRDKDARV